jgi:hypothetical protein
MTPLYFKFKYLRIFQKHHVYIIAFSEPELKGLSNHVSLMLLPPPLLGRKDQKGLMA